MSLEEKFSLFNIFATLPFDTETDQIYSAETFYRDDDPTQELIFSAADTPEEYKSWLANRALEEIGNLWTSDYANSDVNMPKASEQMEAQTYFEAVSDWVDIHGHGFNQGTVQIKYLPGNIFTNISTIMCTLEDAHMTWVSYFKGAVLVFNEQEGTFFVVYVPGDKYDWIAELVADSERVWMFKGLMGENETEILTFNKQSQSLEWRSREQMPDSSQTVVNPECAPMEPIVE